MQNLNCTMKNSYLNYQIINTLNRRAWLLRFGMYLYGSFIFIWYLPGWAELLVTGYDSILNTIGPGMLNHAWRCLFVQFGIFCDTSEDINATIKVAKLWIFPP